MDGARVRREAAGLGLALLALALAWDAGGLDLAFARLAGSPAGFPWRDHWLLAGVLHQGMRPVSWLLALVLCLAVWWPVGPFEALTRRERLLLAVSTLAAALAVSVLKAVSRTSCPWELAQFGGLAQYASHWSLRPDGGTGRCFPAGHAGSGFSLLGGYFAWRRSQPLLARRWVAAALAVGTLLGLAQQWRGAHFMSHTLWSAVVCWATVCLVHAAWRPARRAEGNSS